MADEEVFLFKNAFFPFDTTDDPDPTSYLTDISDDRLGHKGKNPVYSVLYLSPNTKR